MLTITLGLPASGKTTWAIGQVKANPPSEVVRLNRDSLRLMLHAGPQFEPGEFGPQPRVNTEEQVSRVARLAAAGLFETGARHLIVDDTNMTSLARNTWSATARDLDAVFGVKSFLDVPVEECVRRDNARLGMARVGGRVIRAMDERHGHSARVWYELVTANYEPDFKIYEKRG
jgi:predicted kinase